MNQRIVISPYLNVTTCCHVIQEMKPVLVTSKMIKTAQMLQSDWSPDILPMAINLARGESSKFHYGNWIVKQALMQTGMPVVPLLEGGHSTHSIYSSNETPMNPMIAMIWATARWRPAQAMCSLAKSHAGQFVTVRHPIWAEECLKLLETWGHKKVWRNCRLCALWTAILKRIHV